MCVAVVLMKNAELKPEEIYKMGNANGDGFGIAWVEDGVVNWWKTLNYNVEYLTHVVNTLKDSPRFVHFRLSTVGGVNVNLCHPFEVGPRAAHAERGHANKVMMHNGHWFRAGEMYDILKKENALPDDGPWSDTRLAAFLASWDEEWLTTVTGKVATLDSEENIKLYGDWTDLREGIKVSNKGWDHNYDYRRTGSGRRWEGWGWSDKNWVNKEAHEKEKKEAKEKEEKEKEKEKEKNAKKSEKEGNKGTERKEKKEEEGKNGQITSGTSGVHHSQQRGNMGVGQGARHLLPSGGGRELGKDGERGEKEGQKAQGEEVGGDEPGFQTIDGIKYDLRPWYSSTNGVWYQVDPNNGSHRLRTLTEAEARKTLEQIAAAGRETGGKKT